MGQVRNLEAEITTLEKNHTEMIDIINQSEV